MSEIHGLGVCSRCKEKDAHTFSRKEAFCKDCFIRFISGKQRKQMNAEKFKVKFGQDFQKEKVLLPLSFGASSIVLLDIIVSLFHEQKRNQRAQLGFEVDVLFIDDSSIRKYENSYDDVLRAIKEKYGQYLTIYPIKFTRVDINSFVSDKKSLNEISLFQDFTSFKYLLNDDSLTINKIFKSCPNRASKHDLQQLINKRLIKKYALAHNIGSILWGHNMTTLAEEVIALTVKGRGSEVYSQLSDGIDLFNGHEFEVIHPLRDVSKGEINTFLEFQDLSSLLLISVDKQENLMNKQKTINEVVSNYYKIVDQDYDNIVSTVVKTGAKLAEPKHFDNKTCSACNGKIYNQPMKWLRDITFKSERGPENELEEESLREWKEAKKDEIEHLESSDRVPVDLCYGCAVTIGGLTSSTLLWPVNDEKEKTKQEILDEFIIGEDEDE